MPSLLELVERVNKGELIDAAALEAYQESSNAAEKFLANHARAMLDLRRSHTFLLEALEAIDYADQKVLFQFMAVLGFLGMNEHRKGPMIRFGAAAIGRREVSLGLEAIQAGMMQETPADLGFGRDRETAVNVAGLYDRAALAAAWYAPTPAPTSGEPAAAGPLKIGYLTSTIADEDASAKFALGLSKHLDAKATKLHVYSTEALARREKQTFTQGPFVAPSPKRGKETIDTLTRRKAAPWLAPLDHDLASTAKELASQIAKDGVDVLLIDAQLNDPIAALIANWAVATVKINLVRRAPLLSGTVGAAVYVNAKSHKADEPVWKKRSVPTYFVQEGVDIAAIEPAAAQRSAFGIPEQSVVLSTVTEADAPLPAEFIETAVAVLRQHPQAVWLVAGEADTSGLKRRLDAAGLGKRCGFAGKRKDVTEFLKMADVYVAPFGQSNTSGILAAMAAGRAVVASAGDAGEPQRPQALIGDDAVAHDTVDYAEKISKLLRDPVLRNKAGDDLKARVKGYSLDHTARAIEKLCRDLLDSADAGALIAAVEAKPVEAKQAA
jgi:glycosyltransferase involved in cell wall biosynthesis